MGLPTPNLFTGGHEFHSPREWVSVQDLAAATATIIRLAEVWCQPVAAPGDGPPGEG
jgi:tripeptide aminopeptidase